MENLWHVVYNNWCVCVCQHARPLCDDAPRCARFIKLRPRAMHFCAASAIQLVLLFFLCNTHTDKGKVFKLRHPLPARHHKYTSLRFFLKRTIYFGLNINFSITIKKNRVLFSCIKVALEKYNFYMQEDDTWCIGIQVWNKAILYNAPPYNGNTQDTRRKRSNTVKNCKGMLL